MNGASTSEYSSGCESGWTTYFDQISNSDPYSGRSAAFYANNYQQKGVDFDVDVDVDVDDEDLSMVSDASSAPPNYSTNYYYASEDNKQKQKKKSNNSKMKKESNLCLDDTASSSIFHFSQDNVPPSDDPNSVGHVYSAAHHLQGESVTKKRLSFFKSSTKGKSGNMAGRKRQ